jgi:3-polyprenyl-4-hydroxybenzoate decarboxylase
MADEKQRIIVGVSGATGIVYAARALEILRSLNIETHLVMSKPADLMRSYESALQRYAWRDTEPEENRNPNLYPRTVPSQAQRPQELSCRADDSCAAQEKDR